MQQADFSNKNATVGFVIYYPFQFYIYKNIYLQLAEKAEFIIDMGPFSVKQPDELLGDIVSLLQRQGVSYRVLEYEDYFSDEYVVDFLHKYKALVSVWENGCVQHKGSMNIKKIHYMYGCGKELNFVRPDKRIFDLCLAFGERGNKLLSYFTQSKIVGNARFDDWFNQDVETIESKTILDGLDTSKKTILYLPTHSDLCSIDFLAEELKRVSSEYNILIKLHHFSVREEPNRVKKLYHPNINVYDDDVDALPLLKRADVVISDNSSAIFDAILADKPVLTVDFLDKEFLDFIHKERVKYRRGLMGAATYSGSLEQKIKQEGKVAVLRHSSELRMKLKEALEDVEKYKIARQEIIRENFSFNDGQCGKRAAEAIERCMNESIIEKPILYHAFEAFERRIGIRSFESARRMQEKIDAYENTLLVSLEKEGDLFFSVILIDENPHMLSETLRTLIWQKYSETLFEIIILTKSSFEEIQTLVEGTGKREKLPVITVLSLVSDFSLSLENCIRAAKGERVIFTKSGFAIPYNWLIQYLLGFRKFSESVGIGGYVDYMNLDIQENIFVEYGFYRIGRCMGNWKMPFYSKDFYPIENNIFHQNPFGLLSNTAYTKSVLEKVDWKQIKINSWYVLESFLRYFALKEGKGAFIPFSVINLIGESHQSFKQKNVSAGIAIGALAYSDSKIKNYAVTSLWGVLKELLKFFLDGYLAGRRKLFLVIFLASFYQWLGYSFFSFNTMLKNVKNRLYRVDM